MNGKSACAPLYAYLGTLVVSDWEYIGVVSLMVCRAAFGCKH